MDITKRQLSGKTRTEHDLLGNKEVPVEYYFGVQTMRALENFNISRVRLYFFPELICNRFHRLYRILFRLFQHTFDYAHFLQIICCQLHHFCRFFCFRAVFPQNACKSFR